MDTCPPSAWQYVTFFCSCCQATSGLDSTIALRVFEVLKDLATMGRTVVSSLHQPSSRMFSAMDKILLLGKGHRLYYGDSAEVLSTMESYGYTPEFQSNPADFLLDLASEEESIKDIAAAEAERCKKADGDEILEITTVERNDSTASAASTASTTAAHTYPVSYMEQMYWLFLRSFNSRRAESVGYLFIITTSFSTLIMSVLWWDPSPTNPQTSARLEDILGLLFFAQIFWTFQPLFQALGSFPFDKLVLLKERSAGMYPLSAFFLARSFADIPLALGVPTACTAVLHTGGRTDCPIAGSCHQLSVHGLSQGGDDEQFDRVDIDNGWRLLHFGYSGLHELAALCGTFRKRDLAACAPLLMRGVLSTVFACAVLSFIHVRGAGACRDEWPLVPGARWHACWLR
eukprot:scaffold7444_cov350-Prasinococcus_capsulatus_cf.AAC.2